MTVVFTPQTKTPDISLFTAAITFSSTRQPTINDLSARKSVDQFSQKTISNEILKGLRYLTQIKAKATKPPKKEEFSWGQLDSAMFGRNLITVCNQATDIMKEEQRLLELTSPVYVLGIFWR